MTPLPAVLDISHSAFPHIDFAQRVYEDSSRFVGSCLPTSEAMLSLQNRVVTILKGAANQVTKLFNSVESLTSVVQMAISTSLIWQFVTSKSSLTDMQNSLCEYRAISSATRIVNSLGYFFGGQLVQDIHNRALASIASNIAMVPVRLSWALYWLNAHAATALSQKVGSSPLLSSPVIESLYIGGSLLGTYDRVASLIRGENILYSALDLVSTTTDVAETALLLVPSVHPLWRAFLSFVSSSTSTIAFFLNPTE